MLFGSREKFGIEAQDIQSDVVAQAARIQFWVDNAPIGDWNDTNDLAASARWGRILLKESSRRTRPDLDQLPVEQVFHLLYGRYNEAEDWPVTWDRGPYLLNAVGDSSVRNKATVLVMRRANGWDRLIVSNHRDRTLKELDLEPGLCDEIVSAYCSWVEQLPG